MKKPGTKILFCSIMLCLLVLCAAVCGSADVEYIYDARNRLSKIVYPDDKEIIFEYDEAGNLVHQYAWRPSLSIRAEISGSGTVTPSSATVAYGGSKTFAISPAVHWHIQEVLADGVSQGAVSSYTFSNVRTNQTLRVNFGIDSFPITTSISGGNGTITPSSPNVGYGGNQTFAITPAAGRHITGVLVDGVSMGAITSYTFSNVTAPHSIQAAFGINAYSITTSVDSGSGTISPASASVNHGESRTFTITPAAGSYLTGLKADGLSQSLSGTYTFKNVTVNHTLSVGFTSSGNPVVISSAPYPTLQAAYDAAAAGDTIKCRDFLFIENFTANRDISVTIDGGYTSGFSSNPNKSVLNGAPVIGSGAVTWKNFVITN
ncbi:MAG: RHS repeat domain-containing protein [Syntrophobacteraceae bacterium]